MWAVCSSLPGAEFFFDHLKKKMPPFTTPKGKKRKASSRTSSRDSKRRSEKMSKRSSNSQSTSQRLCCYEMSENSDSDTDSDLGIVPLFKMLKKKTKKTRKKRKTEVELLKYRSWY